MLQEHSLRAAGVFPAVLEPSSAGPVAGPGDELKLVAGTHWAVTADEDGAVRRQTASAAASSLSLSLSLSLSVSLSLSLSLSLCSTATHAATHPRGLPRLTTGCALAALCSSFSIRWSSSTRARAKSTVRDTRRRSSIWAKKRSWRPSTRRSDARPRITATRSAAAERPRLLLTCWPEWVHSTRLGSGQRSAVVPTKRTSYALEPHYALSSTQVARCILLIVAPALATSRIA
eukprot:COSAG03_NODE_3018_length_2285_cov_2.224154_2_plen_232_part_00